MSNGSERSESEPIRIDIEAITSRPASATFSTAGEVKGLPIEERDEFERLRRGEGVTIEGPALDKFLEARRLASTAVFRRIGEFRRELTDFFPVVRPTLPAKLRGELVNPDGGPAHTLMVEVLEPEYGPDEEVRDFAWPPPKVVTDPRGKFSVGLPSVPVPEKGLRVKVRGRNATLILTVPRIDAVEGDLGLTVLDKTLQPLERSVLARLGDLVPVDEEDAEESPEDFTTTQPPLRLGEGDCASEYATEGGTVSRFRYSVLFRLID
ncbi:MAG: hypothetical protein GF328_00395, partial [Candidatus Latescibacteria bacterium]|nr:hypothetical protein [Candidatus Latescibacterota bacterium]